MRVMIWVCTLFIYGALLSGCGALPHQQNGLTERAQIDADVQTNTAAIAATAQANSDTLAAQVEAQRIAAAATTAALDIAANATAVADTNQTNLAIAEVESETSTANAETWSSAVVVMVLLISAGTVVAIVAYWFGRGRVAVVEASARVAIAQLDHNAAIALIDGGPRGNEAFVPMDAYARLYGKDYIIQYDGDPQWYAPTKDKLVRLIEPKQIGHIDY